MLLQEFLLFELIAVEGGGSNDHPHSNIAASKNQKPCNDHLLFTRYRTLFYIESTSLGTIIIASGDR